MPPTPRIKDMESLAQRAADRREKRQRRKKLIALAARAKKGELAAERSEILDWFDKLPTKQLKAVHRAAKIQFGETPWEKQNEEDTTPG